MRASRSRPRTQNGTDARARLSAETVLVPVIPCSVAGACGRSLCGCRLTGRKSAACAEEIWRYSGTRRLIGGGMRSKFLGDESIAEKVKRAFFRHENCCGARHKAGAAFMRDVSYPRNIVFSLRAGSGLYLRNLRAYMPYISRVERSHPHIAGCDAMGRSKRAVECGQAVEAAGMGDAGDRHCLRRLQ